MKRWALGWERVASLLAAIAGACARPTPPPLPAAAEPELRIGIATERPTILLGGDGELILTDDGSGEPVGTIPTGAHWLVMPDGNGLRLRRADGSVTDPHSGVFAVNVSEGRFAMADGRAYRGRLDVVRAPTGVLLVNRVPLESYVASVVAAEMGSRREDERTALLAQAIVSRTRALKSRGRWESQGLDAFADVRDQVYAGVGAETGQAWDAVRATAGQVLMYRGELVDAYFHSTCGYSTAGVPEAFKTAVPRPYLRPVSDASGGGHFYDEISPRFRWREQWEGAALRSILSQTLVPFMNIGDDGLPRISDIAVSRTTSSGRVGELRIVFERGEVRVPGPDVRNVLRPEPDRVLGSLAFQLDVTKQGGEVTRVVATGVGWGHGVGFCQWGAIGRARAGRDVAAILEAYYPGTSIERLY